MLHHRALAHERVVTSGPHAVEMAQSRRSGLAATSAALHPATVDVGTEELEAVRDAEVGVELAIVSDECIR